LGLYAAPTIGDGNCLFRALSDQVYGSPSRHAEVRKEVCDWIEKWGERYEGFVEFEDDEDGEEGGRGRDKGRDAAKGRDREKEKERKSKRLERYLTGMRENGGFVFLFSTFFERFAYCVFLLFLPFLSFLPFHAPFLFF
jgi:hypothetical protein